jgi:Protein of unknown function (DUF1214)
MTHRSLRSWQKLESFRARISTPPNSNLALSLESPRLPNQRRTRSPHGSKKESPREMQSSKMVGCLLPRPDCTAPIIFNARRSPGTAAVRIAPRTPSIRPPKVRKSFKNITAATNMFCHFDKGQMPPVDGFWSVTMYNAKYFFVDNPLNRYNVSQRISSRPMRTALPTFAFKPTRQAFRAPGGGKAEVEIGGVSSGVLSFCLQS